MLTDQSILRGTLHVFVAFDWGDEIDLERARQLLPTQSEELARRRRTPSSIGYRPAPLRYPLNLPPIPLPELGAVQATAEAIVFDFGGASVSLQFPFELSATSLSHLAGALADPQSLVEAARSATSKLFQQLLPVIQNPHWSPLGEEYFVFQLPPSDSLPPPQSLVEQHGGWLAGLVRLESEPLSPSEIEAALQSRISYNPADMLLSAWSASVLIDRDCEETLQAIEFANLQLLEYRYIDNLLDDRLAAAYSTIHRTIQRVLPFWRSHSRPLRQLGELRIEAINLFERTGNALKMVGDQYLARVYRMIAARFHLNEWEQNIRESLDVVEGAYQVVSDQSATVRVELLEITVILLIVLEIVLAMLRH
ncbi:MAG TPA: hypothetical protein VFE46_13685 [Pirellulales bacterium]|jgi:hypothetical protein|nr:hypothetical protein [Pirellulales bacterium]